MQIVLEFILVTTAVLVLLVVAVTVTAGWLRAESDAEQTQARGHDLGFWQ